MPHISFIKIYGPPIMRAIRGLEKIAVKMPDVRIMDTIIMQARTHIYWFGAVSYRPKNLIEIINAVTGWDMTVDEFMLAGERMRARKGGRQKKRRLSTESISRTS